MVSEPDARNMNALNWYGLGAEAIGGIAEIEYNSKRRIERGGYVIRYLAVPHDTYNRSRFRFFAHNGDDSCHKAVVRICTTGTGGSVQKSRYHQKEEKNRPDGAYYPAKID
jgi:hypothetical protein